MESLFESRLEVARVSGKTRFIQARPKVTPEPVIQPDTPIDGGGLGYQTVLHDQGVYRMWYQALPRSWDGSNVEGVGYAESDDGVSWRKPDLNHSANAGLRANLCDLKLHSPSVFIDPDSSPSHRYRAVGYGRSSQLGGAVDSPVHGFYTAHSADGISWEIDRPEPQWDSADVVSAFYHPGREQAIASVKMRLIRNGRFKRAIYNATYDCGQWSAASPALIPDDFDEVCAISRGCASADYYGMGMAAGGRDALIGFISQFRHEGPISKNGYGIFGTADISLAFQSDRSGGWIHAPGRPDFVSHHSAGWTRGGIFSPGSVTEADDEHRFYFAGAKFSHGWYLDEDMKVIESRKNEVLKSGHSAIGYASWPKGRLFGFSADPEGWIDLNLEPIESPHELRLNYSTSGRGSVRVELYSMDPSREWQNPESPADGYGLAAAVPLTGDGFEAVAAWQSGTLIKPIAGKRWLARIHLDEAAVYEFGQRPV